MPGKEKFYKETVAALNITGIEKEFHDLGQQHGPPLPLWLEGQTIYEIYVRAFSTEGTLRAVTKKLSQITALGIKIIWLMPVYPIGLQSRKGSRGSSYAVKDYFRINPEYGSDEDFKELVETAHKAGLKVVLDMVANHVAPDYAALQEMPCLIKRDSKGLPARRIADWSDVADLDYANSLTRKHMLEVLCYWPQKFDIDGYRCDVAGFVPLDFWEQAAGELRQIKADFFMLAEWESPLLHKEAFHSSYDWSLYFLMRRVYDGKRKPGTLTDWMKLKTAIYPRNSLLLHFLENHDMPRAVEIFEGESFLPYLAFIFSVQGVPLLFNGQEIGSHTALSHYEKDEIRWTKEDTELRDLYSRLIHLRQEHKALCSKKITTLPVEDDDNVLVYIKDDGTERILVALNFSAKKIEVEINLKLFFHSGEKSFKPMLQKEEELIAGEKLVLWFKPFFAEYYLVA